MVAPADVTWREVVLNLGFLLGKVVLALFLTLEHIIILVENLFLLFSAHLLVLLVLEGCISISL
jgi:hypothetical protein